MNLKSRFGIYGKTCLAKLFVSKQQSSMVLVPNIKNGGYSIGTFFQTACSLLIPALCLDIGKEYE
jgi:hypothetical protein